MDDSHGIAAYGETGRGTEEYCGAKVDIFVGTFGKAFGVNGGFVAGSPELIEAIRQKADTYIYTNPLGAADCAAALKAVEIADSEEGRTRLRHLKARTDQFRAGLQRLGFVLAAFAVLTKGPVAVLLLGITAVACLIHPSTRRAVLALRWLDGFVRE